VGEQYAGNIEILLSPALPNKRLPNDAGLARAPAWRPRDIGMTDRSAADKRLDPPGAFGDQGAAALPSDGRSRVLGHDPEKACPGLDPGWTTFSEKIMPR
jgi:hypothetical protein